MTWLDGADASIGLPVFATSGAAGADLSANFHNRGSLVIDAGTHALVPTGLAMAIPAGFEVQIRPRSGLALKHGVTLLNTPGTIDSDYRGPVGVIMINHGKTPFEVTHGMRIAQMIVAPVLQPVFEVAAQLDDTARGADGFGSSGT